MENQDQVKDLSVVEDNNGVEAKLIMPSTEEFGKIESMEPGYSLSAHYRKQDEWVNYKDKPIKCFYLGMKEIPNDEGELVNCALFAEKDGVFMAAQKVLVEAVKPIKSSDPIPVQITFLGKKQNSSSRGSTNLFDVRILNAK